jgi:hypothetical protein
MQYINAWPDTIFSAGIVDPDPDIPIDVQRKIHLELAKLLLMLTFINKINELPISSTETIHDLCLENKPIESQIDDYIRSYKITDTIFYSTGQIEVRGFLLTERLKTIIISYFSEVSIS